MKYELRFHIPFILFYKNLHYVIILVDLFCKGCSILDFQFNQNKLEKKLYVA